MLAELRLQGKIRHVGLSEVDLTAWALVAATMLTLSDLVARHAFPGTAIPVGAVTVCLGGLDLVWLLARETSRR
jgi:iron complex transport system permease protein